MFLTDLFKLKKSCLHDKITPDMEFGYCPDCGKLIKNEWFITRCACCGVKMKAASINGEIYPQNHYCTNCGSKEFRVEKLEKINFIDINFAVLQKNEVSDEEKISSTIQCWEEKRDALPRLTVKYL